MRILKLSVPLLVTAVFFIPVTLEAKSPKTSGQAQRKSVSVETQSGKTVELRTMMVGGKMMVLVPMDMSCDVFHGGAKYC
jgi:hypothetical protein